MADTTTTAVKKEEVKSAPAVATKPKEREVPIALTQPKHPPIKMNPPVEEPKYINPHYKGLSKKVAIIIAILASFALNGMAQQPVIGLPVTTEDLVLRVPNTVSTDTNPPPIVLPPAVIYGLEFLTTGSNWMVAPFGIYDGGSKTYGGGIAALYKLSDTIGTGLRVDYLNGKIFMPSMNLQLQVPVKLANKLTMIPFTFGGIATPLTGKGSDNDAPVGMFGIGTAIRITDHLDFVGDIEKWTAPFTGNQYRIGFLYKF